MPHIAVAFNEGLTTSFRNAFFPVYKTNRERPAPELERQLAPCQPMAGALGYAVYADQHYEADGLIGTWVHRATDQGATVGVVSNDTDLMQLVSSRVTFYNINIAKQQCYDPQGVAAYMGVRPEQIPDVLGLQGDAVDNIPGVKGVGAKPRGCCYTPSHALKPSTPTWNVRPACRCAAPRVWPGSWPRDKTSPLCRNGWPRLLWMPRCV
ncbi:Flap endonuclease Xni [Candidatus Entotheonellaceae bacterium PAL068K]